MWWAMELYIGLWGSWDEGLLQSMLIGLILQRLCIMICVSHFVAIDSNALMTVDTSYGKNFS